MTSLVLAAPQKLDLATLPRATVEGLYVHVPFCFHKCHYCDFYSITRQSEDRMARYVDLLLREAEMCCAAQPSAGRNLSTIFFGGGTPTLLPENLMNRLLAGLRERFDLSAVKEWTVEANPATVREDYCAMLRGHGVDRLSFGAQSFNTDELKTLERHHDPEDVERSLAAARSAGFRRLNVDLIYAIPGQDLASWSDSLDRVIALQTPHVSAYNLTYEPNTPMAVRHRLGQFKEVAEDVELQMLRHARSRLAEAGYGAYEISNYARPGEECRHNLVYWTGGNYIGLGPSAASHVEGWRWKNRPHLGEWERAIETGELPATDVESLSPTQRAGELAMLMLRLDRGVEFETFRRRLGLDALTTFAPLIEQLSKLGLIHVDEATITLTDAGIPVADSVASEFLTAVS